MAKQFLTPIDLNHLEIQNAVIQNLATDKASTSKGKIHYDNSLDRLRVGIDLVPANDAIIPFLSTSVASTIAIGDTATAGGVSTKDAAKADHKHAAPGLATTSVSGFMNATDKAKLDNATSANTASRLVIRDASGRAQFVDPSAAQDAATKNYVDNLLTGLKGKESVRVATTGNITLSTSQTIDGVVVTAGQRVLVKNQSTSSQNGIYTVASGAWTRTLDADTWSELVSAYTWVEEGTANADTGWLSTINSGGTLGTTAVTWTIFSSSTTLFAGVGLLKNGNQLDVNVDGTTLEASTTTANSATIRVKDAGISDTKLATNSVTTIKVTDKNITNAKLADMAANTIKGVITAGVPQDLTPSQVRQVLTSDVANLSLTRKYSTDVGNGVATSFVYTHNLASRDVVATLYRNSAPYDVVEADIEHTTTNTITVRFAVAPPSAAYRIVIEG